MQLQEHAIWGSNAFVSDRVKKSHAVLKDLHKKNCINQS